ncbi:MAG: glycosyltransferase [Provencibacterium sp.]|jgi:glycosyltransferase involved in cell wall biosynthesis|nr:glycosyltransferase [Provencibacterium sp.]
MVKLSVVIPVYNVEQYVGECLESLAECSSDAVEILCINDGSTDASAERIEEYAQRDARIQLFSQSNRGLGAARNAGMLRARGEYILFVDSDDFVKPHWFRALLEEIEKHPETDVFAAGFQIVHPEGGGMWEESVYPVGEGDGSVSGMDFLPQFLRCRKGFYNVWRYVYRKSFLEGNQIWFQEGFLCEDLDYTARVFLSRPQIAFLHCPYYCYRAARGGSIMGYSSARRVEDALTLIRQAISELESSDFQWKQLLIGRYQRELLLLFAQLYEVERAERPDVYDRIQESLELLEAGDGRLAHAARRTIALLGIRPVSGLLFGAKKGKRLLQKLRAKDRRPVPSREKQETALP